MAPERDVSKVNNPPCPVCLAPVRKSQDKRGGVFLACKSCHSRLFVKGNADPGLGLLRIVVHQLGGAPRLSALFHQFGAPIALAALARSLQGVGRDVTAAVEEELNKLAWQELIVQLDALLPDETDAVSDSDL